MSSKEQVAEDAKDLFQNHKEIERRFQAVVADSPNKESLDKIDEQIEETNAAQTAASARIAEIGKVGLFGPRELKREKRTLQGTVYNAAPKVAVLQQKRAVEQETFDTLYGPMGRNTIFRDIEQAGNHFHAERHYKENLDALNDMAREEARADGVELNLPHEAAEQQPPIQH